MIVGGGAINTGKGDRVIVGGGAINTGNGDRVIVGGGAINQVLAINSARQNNHS